MNIRTSHIKERENRELWIMTDNLVERESEDMKQVMIVGAEEKEELERKNSTLQNRLEMVDPHPAVILEDK